MIRTDSVITNGAQLDISTCDINVMLEQVKDMLFDVIDTKEMALREMALYFVSNQGKLIRPNLTLACGIIRKKPGDIFERELLCKAAAGVEMLHMSALVHDDIIDKAAIRRGKPTVNSLYGDDMAILLGDYFYSRALKLLSSLSDTSISQKAMDVIAKMTEGEVKQKGELFNPKASIKDYLVRISRKTAQLTSFCCFVGSKIGKLGDKETRKLEKMGDYFGKAYQIRDDILDFISDESKLKKPSADLKQGVFTLPMIVFLRGRQRYNALTQLEIRGQLDSLYRECINTDAVKNSVVLCNRYLGRALEILESFDETKAKNRIIAIIKMIQM